MEGRPTALEPGRTVNMGFFLFRMEYGVVCLANCLSHSTRLSRGTTKPMVAKLCFSPRRKLAAEPMDIP